MRQPTIQYPTALAVAAVLKAIYQTDNKQLVKYDTTEQKSSKTLALEYLANNEPLDTVAAQEAIDFLHGAVTMQIFMGKTVSDFTKKLLEKVQNETVSNFDMGLLAYFPNVYDNAKKQAQLREETVQYNSKFFGHIGDKVAPFTLKVISQKYVQKLDLFVVFGVIEETGNLVQFFTKHDDRVESGKYTGKIKGHEKSQWHEFAEVTLLNYVKKVDQ